MKLKLFCMLTLASTALMASEARMPEDMLRGKNSQYQDGFRDGFREAIRMMNNGSSGGQGNYSRKIQISKASYGSLHGRCDFTEKLGRSANNKSSYYFKAGNQWCGDPSNGYKKIATVEYSCRGSMKRATLREGQSETLRCN